MNLKKIIIEAGLCLILGCSTIENDKKSVERIRNPIAQEIYSKVIVQGKYRKEHGHIYRELMVETPTENYKVTIGTKRSINPYIQIIAEDKKNNNKRTFIDGTEGLCDGIPETIYDWRLERIMHNVTIWHQTKRSPTFKDKKEYETIQKRFLTILSKK